MNVNQLIDLLNDLLKQPSFRAWWFYVMINGVWN